MIRVNILSIAIVVTITFLACSNDSENNGGSKAQTNANRNIVTLGIPAEIARLEFPKARRGTSEVIVHSTTQYGMT